MWFKSSKARHARNAELEAETTAARGKLAQAIVSLDRERIELEEVVRRALIEVNRGRRNAKPFGQ